MVRAPSARPLWPAPGPMAAVGSLVLAGISIGRPEFGLATAALAALALAATVGESGTDGAPGPAPRTRRRLGAVAAVGVGWSAFLLSPHLPVGAGAIALALGTLGFAVGMRPRGGQGFS